MIDIINISETPPQSTIPSGEQKTKQQSMDLSLLEGILGCSIPDWKKLTETGQQVISNTNPLGSVKWFEKSLSIKKKDLRRGNSFDLWIDSGLIILKEQPTFIEKILLLVSQLFSFILKPWYAFQNYINSLMQELALKLGTFFYLFALPAAFLAFLGDIVTIILEFLLSIPRLIFSPFTFLKQLLLLIPQMIGRMLARLIWALLLPIISKILVQLRPRKTENLSELLKKYPWIRYMVLGFFRVERPKGPMILIPSETVTQMFLTERGGIFSRGKYLVIVEGEPMKRGLVNKFVSWLKSAIIPFYWERTVHVICLPKVSAEANTIIDAVESAFQKKMDQWN